MYQPSLVCQPSALLLYSTHPGNQVSSRGEAKDTALLCGVAKSRTRLSDFTLTFHFHALEEEMATHSSVLAWRIPWTEEPGGLPSMGSHRVGHNWSDLAAAAAAANICWFFMVVSWIFTTVYLQFPFSSKLLSFLQLYREYIVQEGVWL